MTLNNNILDTPVEFLKGVGPLRGALLLKELNIQSYGDLLKHFPMRYIDTAGITNISELTHEHEYVQLRGVIFNFKEEGQSFRKRHTATLYDKTGSIELIWFQGGSYVQKNIQPNAVYNVFGKLSFFNGNANISHPEIELFNASAPVNSMQPVYSTTEKLKAKGVTNRSFAKLMQGLFEKINEQSIPEILPADVLQHYKLMPRFEAFRQIHFPASEKHKWHAERRLKWEELLLSQLKILKLKLNHHQQAGFIFPNVGAHFNEFFNNHLPFSLTNAQKRVIKEIRQDTFSGKQMNRLVQGDVGSGKTMVALMSMLLAWDNGFQSLLMAPTEILAQQHYQGIKELLAPLHIPVAILTGTVKGKERKQVLEGLAKGVIPIVIGTHALVEDTVKFQNLGLAIIDEQHRFGVTQRAKLWTKNDHPPHVLVMTATPIPRTLAMTVYGDLDVSVIDELPPGRKPIETIHRSENFRPKVMQFLKNEIEKGRQIYIVYPLIEESEKLDYESLKAGYEQVKAWFPDPKYRVAMVHGKQPLDEKERNMHRFVSGDAHILVATTVIEVGVNVPNASVMVIESSERFGLSQLHQLRGRVGRGSEKSYCILLTGFEISKESRQRMSIMTQTSDGFVIAEEDLKMRGPGDIYGTRQSGALDFKIADIIHDVEIMEETKVAAQTILNNDPMLEQPMHRALQIQIHHSRNKQVQQWNKIS
ncbi:ATP-dependent DNA helicase RecG [Taibaiella lutea]|uniref:ATP-dependent DNA helicase RecG n=1 Tax=Taibaiella lutea TaxID=2608001 RepID=A0A5M6CRV5_9BACT|nr:ATP-dependent DNA helicase RecG [Taibaiella lutea]KAA5537130.1 ATP-dependent DNA helicase RecG [Taibaiella lutea]